MPQDIIRLRNMTFHAHHGVWDEEREIGQRFEVDLELSTDVTQAAGSDKLKDTIDLYTVFESVEQIVVRQTFNLVETIAERVAEKVLTDFAISEVRVIVRKPRAPIRGIQDGIEVEIVRRQQDS